jgi:hypothetical protein
MNLAGRMHSRALLGPGRDLTPLAERLPCGALSRHVHRRPVSVVARRAAASLRVVSVNLSHGGRRAPSR